MKAAGKYRVALVTCGTLTEARRLARAVVKKRLAACVNIVLGPVESWYTWKNKIENAREWLIVIKTSEARLAALESEVKRLHSYDLPEFISVPIVAGSRDYLAWLAHSTRPLS
jgi:periplasmic divalent cation tolerance protein